MVKDNNPVQTALATPTLSERYLSRDLSWLKFNECVLDQVGNPERAILEWLKFLHFSASNLDEFLMARVGSASTTISITTGRGSISWACTWCLPETNCSNKQAYPFKSSTNTFFKR